MQNLFKLNAQKIHCSKFSHKMFIAFSLHNKNWDAEIVCAPFVCTAISKTYCSMNKQISKFDFSLFVHCSLLYACVPVKIVNGFFLSFER